MQRKRITKAVAGGVTLVVLGVGAAAVPALAQNDTTTAVTATGTQGGQPPAGARRGGQRGARLSAAASALGVSRSQLLAALRRLRSERPPATATTPQARREWREQRLADELGIDVEVVRAARQSLRSARGR